MSLPRVSIITVSFRDLEGLRKTRQSIEDQDYGGEIEHIVVDGGSGDEVVEYLVRESIESSLLFVSEKDAGTYDAMNKGIALATGDVYWWLNSADTLSHKNSVAQAVATMTTPRDQWGYGITAVRTPDGVLQELAFPYPYAYLTHAASFTYVPHPSAFVGANLVGQLGGYDLDIPVAADQVFLLRLAALADPVAVAAVLSNFELGGVSSSISYWRSYSEVRRGVRKHQLPGAPRGLRLFLVVCEFVLRGVSVRARQLCLRLAGVPRQNPSSKPPGPEPLIIDSPTNQ